MSTRLFDLLAKKGAAALAAALKTERSTEDEVNETLREAVWHGYAEALPLLVSAGGNLRIRSLTTSWPLLHLAVENQQTDVIAELLRLGADIHDVAPSGWTALHLAVDIATDAAWQTNTEPDTSGIDVLLEHGADPDRVDTEGRTPYQLAVGMQEPKVVEAFRRRRPKS